ncbi:aldo/keto reductase [Blastomonas aquatica]|uniref:Oxidoreductase n=1 Tax=Blastomonas aquatica TaxID=1510276 RepID=A0ABQ1JS08_9SPHN|nr:aldo/keto reductase [Blastomonas aquatica]GGB73873.1 oxidoreductase [Blastomonas aquatica]
MPHRAINGKPVNPIGLGCMSLSWGYGALPERKTAIALLNRALDLGYNHLDTANIYGLGHNETLMGEALKGRRNEFFLATKMGIVIEGEKRGIDCSPASIRRCIDESLTRLQTDHVDLYYMHRRDRTVPIEESVGAMAELVKEGKIGSIGLSEMSADTLRRAAAVHPIAAMQTEYSPWTREPEIAVLDACRELGTTFVAFSPVARGVLANGVRDVAALADNDLRRTMPRFNGDNWPANRALVDAFCTIAADCGVTPAQLSLAWVLSRGDHIVAIPGTASIGHMEENFAQADWTIPADVAARIDALINQHTVAGPRYGEAMQRTIDTEVFGDGWIDG